MKVIRKFTAIQLETERINDNVNAKLCFGKLDGPHYDVSHPKEEFDTEEELSNIHTNMINMLDG